MTAARPILMSAPMVRALLAGTKTQTRRALKPQPILSPDGKEISWWQREGREPRGLRLYQGGEDPTARFQQLARSFCPYGAPGNLLWVRESHALVGNVDPGWLLYRASGYEAECRRHGFDHPPPENEVTWKPSIHMHRWMSRITLRLTDVRVELLQDISKADALAEGIENSVIPGHGQIHGSWKVYTDERLGTLSPISSYQTLWESINGKVSWSENPWVWALTFDVIKANVDEVLRRAAA